MSNESEYFELKPHYEGERLKIYEIDWEQLSNAFPVEELDEASRRLATSIARAKSLLKMVIKEKGYQICEDLSGGLTPNKKFILRNYYSYYVYDPQAQSLPVQFIETVEGTNYIKLDATRFF